MIQLIRMAYRDLMRNRRRSLFSALALGMGVGLLLLMSSVLRGEMQGSLESSIRLQNGHLQVRAASYDENKNSLAWKDLLENPADLAAQIGALPQVASATPRLLVSGMVATGEKTLGVQVMGIDPGAPASEVYRKGILTGAFLAADDRQGVLVGAGLAKKLNLTAGDSLYLLVNTSSGDVAEQDFTVRGVYTTGTPAFDDVTIFMPLEKAQGISKAGNHATLLFVLLKSKADTEAVAQTLTGQGFQVKTYLQANAIIADFDKFANAYMGILYLIVLAVTATVIVNTLVMAVFERTREIGILSAIGMRGGRIMAMFFAESALLAVGGILIGWGIGALLVLYASKVGFYVGNLGVTGMLLGDRIYGAFNLGDVISLTLEALLVTLVAALYPALLAARMEPVTALRAEN